MIYQHLPFQSSAATALTCARFYHLFIAGLRQTLQSNKTEKFEILCLLEIDGRIKGYHCRGCLKRHRFTASFSLQELEKRPTERYCLRTQRSLRVSRTLDLSFSEVIEILEEPHQTRNPKSWTSVNRYAAIIFSDLNPGIPNAIETAYPMYRADFPASKDWFVALCNRFNIPICPHLRMSDEKITGQFSTDIAFRLWPRRHSYPECSQCKAKFVLRAREYGVGHRYVEVAIIRPIGMLVSPLEPEWLAQTSATRDPALEKYWRLTDEQFLKYWKRTTYNAPQSEELDYLEPDNTTFVPPSTLPRTMSSLMASWGVEMQVLVARACGRVQCKATPIPDEICERRTGLVRMTAIERWE
ncbi:hypothetical protein PRK78_002227 [Emydomyces testavorans]|uniref:Uncharacterized protein n=1 Tax=Emydomyces testavorans TaxID=2070801 RepID=A0AAF0DE11_9EURO|nr:hypothetical protein PRK78_002227 [Emydomyces testavorans]